MRRPRQASPDPEGELFEPLQHVPQRQVAAAQRGKQRFLAQASGLRASASSARSPRRRAWLESIRARQIRFLSLKTISVYSLLVIALGLAALFGGAAATAYAAQSALPGSLLYPVKTGLEGARAALSANAAREVELHLRYAQIRLDELAQLIADNRYDELDQVAAGFEQQIGEAIANLDAVALQQPVEAQRLTAAVAQALARYVEILSGFHGAVPTESQPPLEQALQAAERPVEIELVGVVQSIETDRWIVTRSSDGMSLALTVTNKTEVDPGIVPGDSVKVEALAASDSSYLALEIHLSEPATPQEPDEDLKQQPTEPAAEQEEGGRHQEPTQPPQEDHEDGEPEHDD